MATIDIKANVTAPSEITIPLVRADYHAVSNIFRVFFEVFLACSSTTLGAILAMPSPKTIHWVMLCAFGLSAAAFLLCSFLYGRSSKKT